MEPSAYSRVGKNPHNPRTNARGTIRQRQELGGRANVQSSNQSGNQVARSQVGSCSGHSNPFTIIEISSDTSDSNAPVRDVWDGHAFTTTLYYPYKDFLELPGMDGDWGPNRVIVVKTDYGREYKVKLEWKHNLYTLSDGWDLVVAAERLVPDITVRLEYQNNDVHLKQMGGTIPITQAGFISESKLDPQQYVTEDQYMMGPHTTMTDQLYISLVVFWHQAATSTIMYACKMTSSMVASKAMYFSTQYSKTLPKKKNTVALRFFGSPVAIAGNVQLYQAGVCKITRNWDKFVEEHNIVEGDILLFRCYKGPTVWEFLVTRAFTSD